MRIGLVSRPSSKGTCPCFLPTPSMFYRGRYQNFKSLINLIGRTPGKSETIFKMLRDVASFPLRLPSSKLLKPPRLIPKPPLHLTPPDQITHTYSTKEVAPTCQKSIAKWKYQKFGISYLKSDFVHDTVLFTCYILQALFDSWRPPDIFYRKRRESIGSKTILKTSHGHLQHNEWRKVENSVEPRVITRILLLILYKKESHLQSLHPLGDHQRGPGPSNTGHMKSSDWSSG